MLLLICSCSQTRPGGMRNAIEYGGRPEVRRPCPQCQTHRRGHSSADLAILAVLDGFAHSAGQIRNGAFRPQVRLKFGQVAPKMAPRWLLHGIMMARCRQARLKMPTSAQHGPKMAQQDPS